MRALCLTLPLILVLWACKKEPTGPNLATLIQAQGQVSVQQGSDTRAGAVGQQLYKGDLLTTGPAGTARVRYVNGVEVRVSEGSRFRIDGVPGALTLELEEGQIISTAPAGAPSGLTVRGRFGKAEIVTAAEMVFDLRSEKPKLTLEYGEISVVDSKGAGHSHRRLRRDRVHPQQAEALFRPGGHDGGDRLHPQAAGRQGPRARRSGGHFHRGLLRADAGAGRWCILRDPRAGLRASDFQGSTGEPRGRHRGEDHRRLAPGRAAAATPCSSAEARRSSSSRGASTP